MNIKSILLSTTATLLLTMASASAQAEKTEQASGKQAVEHHAKKEKHEVKAKHQEKTAAQHKKKIVATKPVKKVIIKAPVVAKDIVLRSCAAFGPGYFKVPGTSTCLKFNGRFLGDAMFGSTLNADYFTTHKRNSNAKLGIAFQGRLGAATMTETSLGKLHTYAELRGGYGSGLGFIGLADQEKREAESNGVKIHFAYGELGGVRFGIDESIFNYWTGNFGDVNNNTILNPLTGTVMGTVNYTFNAKNGVSAIIGAETYNKTVDVFSRDGVHHNIHTRNKGENVNLVAGVQYKQGWGDIIGVAAYDSYYESLSGRVRVDGNINDKMTLWAMASVKNLKDTLTGKFGPIKPGANDVADGDNILGTTHFLRNSVRSPYGDWDGAWQALIGGSYKMTPLAKFDAQFGYTAKKTIAASAAVEYQLASGFLLIPELSYVAWHDTTVWTDGANTRTNFLKGKHELQALVHVDYKF